MSHAHDEDHRSRSGSHLLDSRNLLLGGTAVAAALALASFAVRFTTKALSQDRSGEPPPRKSFSWSPRSNRDPAVFFLLASAILSSCACVLLPAPTAAQTPSDQSVIYLNQAWSQDDRDWYYHFSQGSVVLSYDIFLNLEVADGQELFRSDANSERYGLITQPPG
jgi:hypothetical protein